LELALVGRAAITDPVKVEQGLLAGTSGSTADISRLSWDSFRGAAGRRSALESGRSLRPAGREHAKLQNSPMHAGKRRIRRQQLSTRRNFRG